MKKISYILSFLFLVSCTSNTILEPPKDLIPKDSMSLLIQEMMMASSAKFIKNKDFKKGVNYMPFVYDKFKIDSSRFQRSNYYYMSKVDDYIKIFEDAKASLETKKKYYTDLKQEVDSIRRDSLNALKKKKKPKKTDSLKKKILDLDSLPK